MISLEIKDLIGKKFDFLHFEEKDGFERFNSDWPTGESVICELRQVGFFDSIESAFQNLNDNIMFCVSIDMSLYKEETLKIIAEHYEPHVSKIGGYMLVCTLGEELQLSDDEEI